MRLSAAATAASPSPPWTGRTRSAKPSWPAPISLGIPKNPDYNGAIQEGVSYCQRTIENGLRMSAAKAFLHPANKRQNVHVRTHAHATNIIFEGKRAVGVRYHQGRPRRHAGRGARQQGSDPVRRHL